MATTMTVEQIEALAAECAAAALAEGAEARALTSQEDALPGDYEALADALGRPASREEVRAFRAAYSAALAR